MFPEGIEINEENSEMYRERNTARDFPTHIKLFSNHNGLRRNKMHLFMAPTGVGKSTFVRTMIVDFVKNNPEKKMLIWLSEETKEDFMEEIVNCLPPHKKLADIIHIMSEQSLTENDTIETIKKYMIEAVEFYGYDVVVMDNLTTSRLYEGRRPDEQSAIAMWLKNLCKSGIALFIIAHTGARASEMNGKMLDENDVRGSKSITTLTEFLYILQPFYVGNKLYQFLITKKHRSQELHSRHIALDYCSELKIFKESRFVGFSDVVAVYKLRNKLSDK
jgi:archaellum biogenesis ATPase FlaH